MLEGALRWSWKLISKIIVTANYWMKQQLSDRRRNFKISLLALLKKILTKEAKKPSEKTTDTSQ